MSIKNWPGGRISPTPPTPSGPYENSTASGVWTLDQVAYWRQQNLWPLAGNPAPDPNFEYVTMLLPGNGTNGAQNNTFLDSSSNNFSITRNGVTTQGTFSPYGSNWSNYFDGTGDALTIPTQTFSGNFTWECWYYAIALGSTAGNYSILMGELSTSNIQFSVRVDGRVNYYNSSTTAISTSPGTIVPGTWYHLALVRSGSTTTLYINGSSVASASDSGPRPIEVIGNIIPYSDAYAVNGYLSNVRLASSAIYTANFTPSTTPLTAVSGTVLLTCQSNRLIDNSGNNLTITRTGEVNAQRFSPFNTTTSYAAGTIGGSGYFDGASWLDNPSSSTAYAFGTGDFTIEGFAYRDVAGTSDAGLFALSNGLRIVRFGSSTIRFILGATTIGETVPSVGQWFHWAAVRRSGTMYLYINGVSTFSSANSTNVTGSISSTIGRASTSSLTNFYTGFLSSIRVTKGAALYTANFTPPSTPLTTTVSGGTVELLTNFTNAGIIDNAMMIDLETVGTAQISTAQSKFGGSSMYFAGGSTGWLYSNQIAGSSGRLGATYTIEMFLRVSNVTSFSTFFRTNVSSTGNNTILWRVGGGDLFFDSLNSDNATTTRISGGGLSVNTWYHIAVSASQNSGKMFVNGVQVGSTVTFNPSSLIADGLLIGELGSASGYIDELRITKGVARYTANFTPPTAPFPTFGG